MAPLFTPKHRFDCNILQNNYFTSSGHKLRVAIQNTSTPLMDLYVRESLQNSLDAARTDVNEVYVNYEHGEFDIDDLADFYDVLGPKLKAKKEFLANEFVAICDSNTIGLIGRDDGIVTSKEKNQHLGNLVFNIQNAQQNEGAGGFWGLGKTVFYRMSQAGLVIFYSRIKKEDNSFEERLTSVLVEDEQKPSDCFLGGPEYIGISFYGKNQPNSQGGQTRTQIIKEHEFCSELLKVFGIETYEGEKTGTVVIVPFVERQMVCDQHPDFTQHGEAVNISWTNSFGDYLRTCILRWYLPRMSRLYRPGPRLIATINGERVKLEDEDIFFKSINQLYEAIVAERDGNAQPVSIEGLKVERIQADRGYTDENTLGWLGFMEISAEELGIFGSAPGTFNLPPAIYAGLENDSGSDLSYPIIAYCRKPGMIVSYNTKNDWTANTEVPLEKDHFVIGLFVLHSAGNIIKGSSYYSLEEYVRSGEKADHCEWFDHPLEDGKNRLVVRKIKAAIGTKLKESLIKKGKSEAELTNNVIWQKKLSRWLPSGQGKRSSPIDVGPKKDDGRGVKLKNLKFKMEEGAVFLDGALIKRFEIIAKEPFSDFTIEIGLDSATSALSADKFSDYGLRVPFAISAFFVQFDRGCYSRSLVGQVAKIDCRENEGLILDCLKYRLKTTESGEVYAISFSSASPNLQFKIGITVEIFDPSIQLVYSGKIGEVN